MDLPCKECGGQCCTYPAMSKSEFKKIKKKYGFPKDAHKEELPGPAGNKLVMIHREDGYCPYLKNGRCSVYEVRPLACRKYGEVPEMPCQYLYPDQAKAKVQNMLGKLKTGT